MVRIPFDTLPNSDRARERRGMFASAETQAAWQISNLARGRDNAVPPFRVRSGWNKCNDGCARDNAASRAFASQRPIDAAKMQVNLGNALVQLGERESGTGKLTEAHGRVDDFDAYQSFEPILDIDLTRLGDHVVDTSCPRSSAAAHGPQ